MVIDVKKYQKPMPKFMQNQCRNRHRKRLRRPWEIMFSNKELKQIHHTAVKTQMFAGWGREQETHQCLNKSPSRNPWTNKTKIIIEKNGVKQKERCQTWIQKGIPNSSQINLKNPKAMEKKGPTRFDTGGEQETHLISKTNHLKINYLKKAWNSDGRNSDRRPAC